MAAMRAMWSGVLEVNTLFKLHVAIAKGTEEYRGKDPLRELCGCCHKPFTRQSVCEAGSVRLTEEMRANDETEGTTEMVKGVLGDSDGDSDEFVVLDDDALASIAEAGVSDAMAVAAVVDLDRLPIERFGGLYYLRPDSKVKRSEGAVKVVVAALKRQHKALITKWAPRGKEMLVAIYPDDGALAMKAVMFASEVRAPDTKWKISTDGVGADELKVAEQLLGTLPAEFEFDAAVDNTVAVRQAAIEAARAGKPVPKREPAAESEAAPDLMAALTAAMEGTPAVSDQREHTNGKVPVAA
jgi:non-homologous end joining protein Ku